MGAGIDDYSVDPDELDDIVHDLEKTESSLQSLTGDLEQQMRILHEIWEGLAAQAHHEAHQQWTDAMAALRQAMADLRAAARAAHGNYTAAGQANLDMWNELT